MSESFSIPQYLVPVYQLGEGVEVVSAPTAPLTNQDNEPKRNQSFLGMQAYRVGVEVIYSEREAVRDGELVVKESVKALNVTVWSTSMPQLSEGNLVRFTSLMVGAFEASVFVQALGVEVIEGA